MQGDNQGGGGGQGDFNTDKHERGDEMHGDDGISKQIDGGHGVNYVKITKEKNTKRNAVERNSFE